ncbi:hypothetical protein EBB54_27690 [Schaedlerella arabinosiphila]|uniref:Uncharacterized protein n=1 Tax=Schaedlerella arabinosiphila TaxID=2044587 RepID=A0A426DPS4_9FIRM|nr:DUF6033 family protein [Schaedlerella arabinosiphila]MDE7067189.1 hypothetical protein [Schaedlerella arabinosiphila]RRK34701.1 hypothetical protein EBB54_27690 [Schaedlerella arabinosiphila]
MNFSGVGRELTAVSRYARKSRETADIGSGFLKLLEKMGKAENPSGAEANPGVSAEMSKSDIYRQYLKQKYGNVMIQNVENNQKSIDKIGAGTAGTNNVVIAPNILEQMANDPKKASYYEGQIRHYFDTLPQCSAQLSLLGHEIHSSGIVIHPDGTVTHYISGDLKPEVRARIEARIKAESEEKARRKRMYQKRSEESARLRAIAENSRAMHDAARQQVNSCGLILDQ